MYGKCLAILILIAERGERGFRFEKISDQQYFHLYQLDPVARREKSSPSRSRRPNICLRGGTTSVSDQVTGALDDEIMALEAIYGADIHVTRYPLEFRADFGITIALGVRLRLLCTSAYPSEPPAIVLEADTTTDTVTPAVLIHAEAELRSHLAPLLASLRGSAMILDLCSAAQQWAASSPAICRDAASTPVEARQADSTRAQSALTATEDESASADTPTDGGGGTPVTAESFAQLRARMLLEAPPVPRAAATPLASPLTGREIWQRRLREGLPVADEEDSAADESGAAAKDSDAVFGRSAGSDTDPPWDAGPAAAAAGP